MPKKRKLTVKIHDTSIDKSWSNSALHVVEYGTGGVNKEVVIKIDEPSDLSYLRDRLNEIEAYWKGRLGNA